MSTEDVKMSDLKVYKRVAGKLDIRRFLLESKSVSPFGDLMGKLARAYKVEPSSILVYWKDSEGDFVSIEEDDDVRVAINAANSSLLKLYVTDQSKIVSEEFGEPSVKVSCGATSASEGDQARGGVHHPYVTCDGCNSAIFGRRFKCLECEDYDLCERCELVFNRHPEHNMVVIRRPSPSGCPFMFAGRRRTHGGPAAYPGCPVFGPRGSRCGRFRCAPPQGAEKPQTAPNEQDSESMLNMRFGDLLREAQNGQLPTVLAAMNEALRPLGADLTVLCGEPASRCDSSTATERSSNENADSSEQTGVPMNWCSEQSSEARPSTSSTSVETMRVVTNDKLTQSSESQPTSSTSVETMRVVTNDKLTQSSESQPTTNVSSAGRYTEELKKLTDMGFDNTGGWIEQLLVEKKGNLLQVLEILMSRQW